MRKYTEEIFKVRKMKKLERRKFFRDKIAKKEEKLELEKKKLRDAQQSVVNRPKRESIKDRNRRLLDRPITPEEIEKLKEDWERE